MPFQVFIRAYEELNNFLPAEQRKVEFPVALERGTTVGKMVENLDIPPTQVDLILVNGKSVDLSCKLKDGDRISLYPVFESIDISPVVKVRDRPLRRIRFVADRHLGRLVTYLRMLGFDTLYRNDYKDEELVRISVDEGRVLLSQDRGLLRRKEILRGYLVRESDPHRQIKEVISRFDLQGAVEPFGLCLRCNIVLKPVPKEAISDRLPPETRKKYEEFWVCPSCERIYWMGKLCQHMQQLCSAKSGPTQIESIVRVPW